MGALFVATNLHFNNLVTKIKICKNRNFNFLMCEDVVTIIFIGKLFFREVSARLSSVILKHLCNTEKKLINTEKKLVNTKKNLRRK